MRRTTRTRLALMALAVFAAGAARPVRAGRFYTLTDLGTLSTLGGTYSVGYAVNDSGQVVGEAATASGSFHAFLYSGGRMLDLNSLIAAGSGFTPKQANGISNTGYITGFGTASNGQFHAFLLTARRDTRAVRPGAAGDRGRGLLSCYAARRRARPEASGRTERSRGAKVLRRRRATQADAMLPHVHRRARLERARPPDEAGVSGRAGVAGVLSSSGWPSRELRQSGRRPP
jgi:probable HAF family extracellular repeat protein